MVRHLPDSLKKSAELDGGSEARRRFEMLDMAGKGIVQRPQMLTLVHRRLIARHHRVEQTYRNNLL